MFIHTLFLPNVGGTEELMYHYAKELIKKGHKVSVFVANALKHKLANLKKEEYIDGICVKRFKFIPLPYFPVFFAPKMIPALLSVNADIFLVFGYTDSLLLILPYLIAKIKNIPVVSHPQSQPLRFFRPSLIQKIRACLFEWLIGVRMLKMADHILAVSDIEANFYRMLKIQNVSVIYEGVSINPPVSEEVLSKFMSKYGLEGKRVLLMVARITKTKGHHFLIKSLPHIIQRIPNVKLVCVGEDWGYLKSCIELADKLHCRDKIIFTGLIDKVELSAAFKAAEIVISPSEYEGFGRIVLEAWAHTKPIIVSERVPIASLVIKKRGGAVVKYGDVRNLAKAIIELLENPQLAREMGNNGYQFVNNLSWEKVVNKIEKILEMVISARFLAKASKGEKYDEASNGRSI